MKLWVVNHPYRYRRWLKVEARLLEHEGWHEGFVWSEWFGDHDEGAFHVPRLPENDLIGANIDPLVIGPHMYFDYCRKATSTGKNNRERNELEGNDLILFGCSKLGHVILDTVFVVGETKQWGPRGIPKIASKEWGEWLMSGACPHRRRTQRREYLENAAGMKFEIDRSRPMHELKREAVAHMLQGQEAAFIHHLTILSTKSGFVPISNQHDGLVTLGAVPDEATAEAARLSCFADAHLEQKAFV